MLSAALLGASTTLAAPSKSRASRRAGKRTVGKTSLPMMSAGDKMNSSMVDKSTNWSGAVLVGTNYTFVTGKIVVPTVSSGSSNNGKVGSAWVGIDGDTCSSLWQTGVSWNVTDGTVDYAAWYEWVPYSASGKQDSP